VRFGLTVRRPEVTAVGELAAGTCDCDHLNRAIAVMSFRGSYSRADVEDSSLRLFNKMERILSRGVIRTNMQHRGVVPE
jgi:hypothetical protein